MQRIKQLGIWLGMAVMLMAVCTGCTAHAGKEVDPVQAAEQLKQALEWQDTLTRLDDGAIALLYNIRQEDVSAQCVYASTGATAEEVAVFTATDDEAVERILQAAQARVTELRSGFENYVPQEMQKLANPVLCVRGNTVILCIHGDNERALEEIDTLFQ